MRRRVPVGVLALTTACALFMCTRKIFTVPPLYQGAAAQTHTEILGGRPKGSDWLSGFENHYETTFPRETYKVVDTKAGLLSSTDEQQRCIFVDTELSQTASRDLTVRANLLEVVWSFNRDVLERLPRGSIYVFHVNNENSLLFAQRFYELQNGKMKPDLAKLPSRISTHGIACWSSGGCAIEIGMFDQISPEVCAYAYCSSEAAEAGSVVAKSEFFRTATQTEPVTDKISHFSQQYHYIYGKYFDTIPRSRGPVMEIGFGCKMNYGPGASASLWTNLGFENVHFIEYNEACLLSVNATEIPRTAAQLNNVRNENGPDTTMEGRKVASAFRLTLNSGSSITVPALISLGYLIIHGTLCPPSHAVPFPSLYIPDEPA